MTQPPLYPLPWWIVSHSPALASVNRAIYRAAWQLALAYWSGGCADLPADDVSLAHLAHLPPEAWRLAKSNTLAALAHILPHLKREHDRLDKMRAIKRARMAVATAAQRQKRTPATVTTSQFISPTRSPVAPTQRTQIAAKNAAKPTGTEARFTD